MEQEEKIYAHAFNQFPQIGAKRLGLIQKHFGSFKAAWRSASLAKFLTTGMTAKTVRAIFRRRRRLNPTQLWKQMTAENIVCLDRNDSNYPRLLKEIHSPPFLLYIRGKIKSVDDLAVAIVGTRKLTTYGDQVTNRLAAELAANSITVVSGLALGIDSLAHNSTLAAGGRTVAVLGGSVAKDEIYPRSNSRLAEKIVRNGALISEYPPGTKAFKHHFPLRNRIISGLCRGTIVVEAGRRSGALITAFTALEQNREVMAVPGNITAPMSAGCNMLITKGAALVRNCDDIFAAMNLEQPRQTQAARQILPETAAEKKIFGVLTAEPIPLERIIFLTKFDVNVISSTLSIMELKGLVRHIGGSRYIKL